mmetsp:Transcript_26986/g.48952  ORF Transcript_26986/g.48952 Transcript_26986/m.48952 type:complete len:227 (-) Transcript_26986:5866-6546(-)
MACKFDDPQGTVRRLGGEPKQRLTYVSAIKTELHQQRAHSRALFIVHVRFPTLEQCGLRFQHHRIAQYLEVVGAEGITSRGDIRNTLCRQVFDGALCSALAVDQLIVRYAIVLQELTNQTVVLGRNPKPETMSSSERRRGGIQIFKRIDINPTSGNPNYQISMPKAKLRLLLHLLLPLTELFSHQVGSGHAKVNTTCCQLPRYFARRQQDQLDTIHARNRARIFAV